MKQKKQSWLNVFLLWILCGFFFTGIVWAETHGQHVIALICTFIAGISVALPIYAAREKVKEEKERWFKQIEQDSAKDRFEEWMENPAMYRQPH